MKKVIIALCILMLTTMLSGCVAYSGAYYSPYGHPWYGGGGTIIY